MMQMRTRILAEAHEEKIVPPSLIAWMCAVYDPDCRATKVWRAHRRDPAWGRRFRCAARRRIMRPQLPPAASIPVLVPELLAYDYFPIIRNIVATCHWLPMVDLARIVTYIPNAELATDHATSISIRVDKIMCRFFASGIINSTTSQTVEQAKFTTQQCRMMLERIPVPVLVYDTEELLDYDSAAGDPLPVPRLELHTTEYISSLTNFRIVNVVASAVASPQTLDLAKIVAAYAKVGLAVWEPELFPGAKLSITASEACPIKADKVTVRLFDTGRNMIMGLHIEDIKLVQRYIREWVKPYVDLNLPLNTMLRHDYRRKQRLKTQSVETIVATSTTTTAATATLAAANVVAAQTMLDFFDNNTHHHHHQHTTTTTTPPAPPPRLLLPPPPPDDNDMMDAEVTMEHLTRALGSLFK